MVGLLIHICDSAAQRLCDDVLALIAATVYRDRVVLKPSGYPQLKQLRHLLAFGWVSRQWRRVAAQLVHRSVILEQTRSGQWLSNRSLLGMPGEILAVRDIYVTSSILFPSDTCPLVEGMVRADRVHYAVAPHTQREVVVVVVVGSESAQHCGVYRRLLGYSLSSLVVDLELRCCVDHRGLLLMVRRCAGQLECLRLLDIPAAWVGDILGMASSSYGGFPKLKTLDLRFLDDSIQPIDGSTVPCLTDHWAFGALEFLCVVNFPLDITRCLGVFPLKGLRGLRLDMVWRVAKTLLLLPNELRSLDDSLQISCTGALLAVSSTRVSNILQNVLSASQNARKLRLELNLPRPFSSIDIATDVFPCLSVLEIHFAVHLGCVQALISRMPVLRRLAVPYVSTAPESLGCLVVGLSASVSVEVVELGLFDYQVSTAAVCAGLM
ncbi:hypothetical protein FB639_002981, partial [Coemansia asiatica]